MLQKSSILMVPYLISDIMQLLFFAGTSYIWLQNPSNTTVDRGVAIFNIGEFPYTLCPLSCSHSSPSSFFP